MLAEEYALLGGPFDGATFHIERQEPFGTDCIVAPIGQDSLWQVASFDEGGTFIRFLTGPLESTNWLVYQYKLELDQPGRYVYAGILMRSDGRNRTKDVIARLKGDIRE